MRQTTRRPHGRAMFACVFAVLVSLITCGTALATERGSSSAISVDSLLSSQNGSGVAQVERIALGSTGATVTLESGQEIALDFGGLAGVGGGPNYVGWAMVLFGLSIVVRLLSTLSRILRPFGYRKRRSRYDDE